LRIALLLLASNAAWAQPEISWRPDLNEPFSTTIIGGNAGIVVRTGTAVTGDMKVGINKGDRARFEVDGAKLILVQDSLRVGEYTDGEAEFVLTSGAMHCVMDVFVGAATSSANRANHSTLRIRGGSFLGRTITAGLGYGSEARISIEGSNASAVHVLDYVYIESHSDPRGRPGDATLAFTLDEHGVTPVTIQSRTDGLRIVHDARSHSRLRISLSAVPPREDVTLVASHVAIRGTFEGLPEDCAITAQYQGQTYRWQLTYRGGPSGHDLVLRNRSEYAAGAPVTQVRSLPEPPSPLWREHPLFGLENIPKGEPAFSGAEGFGAFSAGGRGGRTVDVSNLNDAGPGSLREALEASGPRIVRFRVGGTIALKRPIVIKQPFLTIDGQDAPAPGILIRDHGLEVRTHDVVLRYFRIRIGDDNVRLDDPDINYSGGEGEYALYFTEGSSNSIADHLSLSWTTTKILSTTKMSDLITIQYCILSEALNFSQHGFSSLAGGNRVTWHHNLFAHNLSRNVRFQGPSISDFRNNVIYDWGHTAGYGEFDRVNYIGNYLKPGPSTTQRPRRFHDGVAVVAPGSLYVAGNVLEGDERVNEDNWRGMGRYTEDRATIEARDPFPAPPVTTEPARTAYEHVLRESGASLPSRDAVDTRVVREVKEGSGRIINWVRDVNGWAELR
jgi:hypothetical protein